MKTIKRIRLAVLLLLPALTLRADAPLVVDWLETFEAEATPLTTTALNAGLKTSLSGRWAINGSSAYFFTSTNGSFPITRTYTVRGITTNAVDSGTRGMAIRYYPAASDSINVAYTLSTGLPSMSFGFYFENNLSTSAYWDVVLFEGGGGYAVPQWRGSYYWSHTDAGGGTGARIPVSTGKHWITGKRTTSGQLEFAVYNALTHTKVGTNSFLAVGGNNVTILKMSTDGHGTQQDVTNYFDNFMVTTNAADFPLLPWSTSNTYYVRPDGNDSNNGQINSAGGAFLTLGKASATVQAGDVVRVQPGTYNGIITMSTDGTSNAPITYLADGAVTARVFSVSGDYTKIIGFNFYHTNDLRSPPISVTGARGVQLLDNSFVHTSGNGNGSGITYGGGCNDLVIRGNTFSDPGGARTGGGGVTAGKCIGDQGIANGATNVLIEYNVLTHAFEYMNPTGTRLVIRNNVGGPTYSSDYPGLDPHQDFVQCNSYCNRLWLENTWHVENALDNAHLFLAQYGRAANVALLGNVSVRNGDSLSMEYSQNTNFVAAHNIVAQLSTGPTRSFRNWHAWTFNNAQNFASSGIIESRNNIFTNCTSSADGIYGYNAGQIVHDHDSDDRVSSLSSPVLFRSYSTAYAGYPSTMNLLPAVGSSAIDAGGALTRTTSAGSGTSIAVANASWFYDGGGLTAGQVIYIGANNNLQIASVNYSANTITVTTPISWSSGAGVGLAYRGSGPDVGAYEYGDALLTAATINQSGNDYTVTTDGDARMVVFYQDGIPETTDFSAPFTATIPSGVVTAKAYALHAQANPVVTAGLGGPAPLSPPSISLQPTSQTNVAGQSATFTAAAGGNPAPSYMWQTNNGSGTFINVASGGNSSSWTTPTLAIGMNGRSVRVALTNSQGYLLSDTVYIGVTNGTTPVISVQPQDATTSAGGTASFTVVASGGALSYQWLRGGAAIPGATSSVYTTNNVTLTANGSQYSVVIINGWGAITSQVATLTVNDIANDVWYIGNAWTTFALANADDYVQFSFDAYVSHPDADFGVGFSPTAVDAWSDMGPIVLFGATGVIQARNAGVYMADTTFAYVPNTWYHITGTADILTHRYSVSVNGTPIATNYAFRTEQAGATQLSNFGATQGYSSGATVSNLVWTPRGGGGVIAPPTNLRVP